MRSINGKDERRKIKKKNKEDQSESLPIFITTYVGGLIEVIELMILTSRDQSRVTTEGLQKSDLHPDDTQEGARNKSLTTGADLRERRQPQDQTLIEYSKSTNRSKRGPSTDHRK